VTEVEFHSGVADKLGFACRLARRAQRSGARVVVHGDGETLAALDRLLWVFDERDFVPHVRFAAHPAPAVVARTPIWLAAPPWPEGVPPVLVNLGAEVPDDLAPFARVIEIVGTDPDDHAAGRLRWRTYRARALPMRHHPAPGRDDG
jgi:DNA polymerase-3 subunit chi